MKITVWNDVDGQLERLAEYEAEQAPGSGDSITVGDRAYRVKTTVWGLVLDQESGKGVVHRVDASVNEIAGGMP